MGDDGESLVRTPPIGGGVLYYALGGGLGHLTRAVTFLQQQGLQAQSVILAATRLLEDPRVAGGIATLRVPDEMQYSRTGLRDWLSEQIENQRPRLICVDAFPGGLLGELCELPKLAEIELWHLARLLQWPRYAATLEGQLPRYSRIWRLEPLLAEHEAILQAHCDNIIDLRWGQASMPAAGARPATPSHCESYWLVLHSGPQDEVAELVAHADEMRRIEGHAVQIIVCSQAVPSQLPEHCRAVDVYPATALIANATRIFSAAGFNVIRETAGCRQRQHIIPFLRRFDDQYERARRARREDHNTKP